MYYTVLYGTIRHTVLLRHCHFLRTVPPRGHRRGRRGTRPLQQPKQHLRQRKNMQEKNPQAHVDAATALQFLTELTTDHPMMNLSSYSPILCRRACITVHMKHGKWLLRFPRRNTFSKDAVERRDRPALAPLEVSPTLHVQACLDVAQSPSVYPTSPLHNISPTWRRLQAQWKGTNVTVTILSLRITV